MGCTRWFHPSKARRNNVEAWTQKESAVEFMRFQNVDRHPEPRDLKVTWTAWGEKALRVPYFADPLLSIAQEPSLVRLPDQSLFCVMRTNSGYIWYSLSKDDGDNWCNPRPLLRKDCGQPILQPVACCPMYQLADGRYILLHHNNRGGWEASPEQTFGPRRPAFIAVAEFRPKADQPLWFSESRLLMDNGGVGVDGDPKNRQKDICVYTSFTSRRGNDILWYPDRKYFLLGKKITPKILEGLRAPG